MGAVPNAISRQHLHSFNFFDYSLVTFFNKRKFHRILQCKIFSSEQIQQQSTSCLRKEEGSMVDVSCISISSVVISNTILPDKCCHPSFFFNTFRTRYEVIFHTKGNSAHLDPSSPCSSFSTASCCIFCEGKFKTI